MEDERQVESHVFDDLDMWDAWGTLLEDMWDTAGELLNQGVDDAAQAWNDMLEDAADAFLEFAFEFGDSINDIEDAVNDFFNMARNWIQRRDPLTLDLDGDGLETTGIDPNNPILFDHDGDGTANATGWVKPDDGYLVFDRNENGLIDNGTELFGDSTPLLDGNGEVTGTATDGFAALAAEDTNNDGIVDAAPWARSPATWPTSTSSTIPSTANSATPFP
jgi:hypothetical protein